MSKSGILDALKDEDICTFLDTETTWVSTGTPAISSDGIAIRHSGGSSSEWPIPMSNRASPRGLTGCSAGLCMAISTHSGAR